MKRQISFSQYRAIDLAILAAVMVLSQALISIAAVTVYSDQLYVVSTVGAVVALVMMRWGGWAAVHAVLGGVLYTALSGGSGAQYVIYGLGNLASLGAMVLFRLIGNMINGFKNYFLRHNEVVYENPSPGNKAGGITTLEDKSCGCVQKGGSAPIMDVIGYGDAVTTKGLNMLYGPGNDLVSSTALTAAGAHMILFTTGRGTPFGAPAPTLKIATNTPLATKKHGWIDFNAGVVADGTRTLDEAGQDLLDLVLEVASGKQTRTEEKGFREISIFKDGVVL